MTPVFPRALEALTMPCGAVVLSEARPPSRSTQKQRHCSEAETLPCTVNVMNKEKYDEKYKNPLRQSTLSGGDKQVQKV